MKIKFKIECKVIQLGELSKLFEAIQIHCMENGIEDLTYANWIYNINPIKLLVDTKEIQNISKNANQKVSFKIDLTQFVLLNEAWLDLMPHLENDIYYSTIFRTIIYEPCILQYEQFMNAWLAVENKRIHV